MYPRSASKPLQAVGMLARRSRPRRRAAGPGLRLALRRADAPRRRSTDPRPVRPRRVRAAEPAGLAAGRRRAGGRDPRPAAAKTRLAMNCSGKHAGMLATTVHNGGDVTTYRDPDHPDPARDRAGHRRSRARAGRRPAIDGCGAPLYAISLYGLARAFGRLAPRRATGRGQGGAQRSASHPEYVSGTTPRRARPAPGHPRAGRQGRRGGGLRGRPARRPWGGGQDQRRLAAGPGRGDGRGAAATGPRQRRRCAAQASAPVLGHGERIGEIRPASETFARLGS